MLETQRHVSPHAFLGRNVNASQLLGVTIKIKRYFLAFQQFTDIHNKYPAVSALIIGSRNGNLQCFIVRVGVTRYTHYCSKTASLVFKIKIFVFL
jgi:hypothetical protein